MTVPSSSQIAQVPVVPTGFHFRGITLRSDGIEAGQQLVADGLVRDLEWEQLVREELHWPNARGYSGALSGDSLNVLLQMSPDNRIVTIDITYQGVIKEDTYLTLRERYGEPDGVVQMSRMERNFERHFADSKRRGVIWCSSGKPPDTRNECPIYDDILSYTAEDGKYGPRTSIAIKAGRPVPPPDKNF